MSQKFITYLFTNKNNGKKYVGFTGDTLERRTAQHWSQAQRDTSSTRTAFHSALVKYGLDGFDKEVIFECECRDAALYMENYYIKTLHTFQGDPLFHGYNLTTGGTHYVKTQESIERHRAQMIGKPKPQSFVETMRKRLLDPSHPLRKSGKDHPMFGRPVLDETRAKISESHKTSAAIKREKRERGELPPAPKQTEAAKAKSSATKKAQAERGEMWQQDTDLMKAAVERRLAKNLKQTDIQKAAVKRANSGIFVLQNTDGTMFSVIGLKDYAIANSIDYKKLMSNYHNKNSKYVGGVRVVESLGKLSQI